MPPWYDQMYQQMLGGRTAQGFPLGGAHNLGMWNLDLGTVPGMQSPAQLIRTPTPMPMMPSAPASMPGHIAPATGLAQSSAVSPSAPPTPPRGGLRGAFPLKGAGGLGLAGLGVSALGPMVWNDPESSTDNKVLGAVGTGLAGAGIGAGIGSVFPGPGTLIGGAAGGLAGGLYGWLQGGKQAQGEGSDAVRDALSKQAMRLTDILSTADTGRDDRSSRNFRNAALQQLQVGFMIQEPTTPAEVKALGDQIIQGAIAALPADQENTMLMEQEKQDVAQQDKEIRGAMAEQRNREAQSQRQAAANIAAVQAWMEPMLREQLDKSQFYADQFGQAGVAAAGEIDNPGLRAASIAMAQQFPVQQADANSYLMSQQTGMPQFLMGQWQQQAAEHEQVRVALDQQLREIQLREQGVNMRSQQLSMQEQLLQQQAEGPGSVMDWATGPAPFEGASGGAGVGGSRGGVAMNPNTGLPQTYGVQYGVL